MRLLQRTLAAVLAIGLSACASDNLEVDTPDVGKGEVGYIELKQAQQVAMYDAGETDMGKLSYGKMDVRYLDVNNFRYVVHWDDHDAYTTLRLGDTVTFRPDVYGRFLRVDSRGADRGNYRIIRITPVGAQS